MLGPQRGPFKAVVPSNAHADCDAGTPDTPHHDGEAEVQGGGALACCHTASKRPNWNLIQI